MNAADFRKLIGANNGNSDYIPVVCLLTTGYGCAGYFSSVLNDDLQDTCVLLNARLVELNHGEAPRNRINDFNDFIEDIVAQHYGKQTDKLPPTELYGSSIPLTAVPFGEIALLYPVAHIASLMKRTIEELHPQTNSTPSVPTFLDFDNKSIVVKVLRTKLW